ncbi:hypothetical protein Syun_026520 [Stephania yunnanensis]|uniref:Uncharacterized protein n=1 Tax=Stephania yunnanensis TaxID=152371 RepID=A0AAP0ETR7_9MAGN
MATSLSSSLSPYSSLFSPSQNPPTAANRASIQLFNLKKASYICCSSKRKTGFFDQILDYIEDAALLSSLTTTTALQKRTAVLRLSNGSEQHWRSIRTLNIRGGAAKGRLSKEDAASICVEALDAVPQKGLVFEVVNGGENVSDWKECFASLIQKSEQFLQ